MSMDENILDQRHNCDQNEKNFNILCNKVDDLYKLRDHYFETHCLEDAIRKNSDVQNELDRTLESFNELKDCEKYKRAKYYYLKGRALNVTQEYNKDAEELLSKAIKLDPKLVDAWNELGECYWKHDNLLEAKNCFTGALNQKKNKISLRNLSMLARQETASNKEDRIKNVERGLQLAKEAVQIDPQDGLSWAILGNAHLSRFFVISQNPKILKQCISAYSQAERDIVAKNTSDLHYNKAITLKYEEEFELALESFNQALKLDPTWEQPKTMEQQLVRYLDNVTELVKTTGKMKGKKRLHQILQSIDSKQLGPYYGGSYSSTDGQSVDLKEISLSELKPGINLEKLVLGKVVCSVHNDDSVPFTFCLVDKKGICLPVMVYNLAEGKGVIIGDSVAIPEPYIAEVKFSYNNKNYDFRSIRVETPLILVVNGRKVSREQQASVQMSIFKKVE